MEVYASSTKPIMDCREAFLDNINFGDIFAVKVFLEKGLIDKKTLDQGLANYRGGIDKDMYLLLLSYGATMPSDLKFIVNLPEELFLEYYGGSREITFEILLDCVTTYDKTKWDMIATEVDFYLLERQQIMTLVWNAFVRNIPDLVIFLYKYLDAEMIFHLILIFGYSDSKCKLYLLEMSELTTEQLMLYCITNVKCEDILVQKYPQYDYIKSRMQDLSYSASIMDFRNKNLNRIPWNTFYNDSSRELIKAILDEISILLQKNTD